MNEDFQFIADELGAPTASIPFEAEERAYMRDRLPPRLVEFLEETGHAVFSSGVTLCPPKRFAPILAMIFKADKDFDHRDCTIVSYTAFGVLLVCSERLGVVQVDLACGEVSATSLDPVEIKHDLSLPKPAGKPNDPNLIASGTIPVEDYEYDFLDHRGERLLADTIKTHGPLHLGECYGFFPALGLAGTESRARSVMNLRRVQASEHFTMLAQLQPFFLTSIASGRVEKVREIG